MTETTNKHEGMIRGFYWLSKAWYADANLHGREFKDDITFGYYDEQDGGTTGEMSMCWYELGGKVSPKLEVFDDAWSALSAFTDVIARMGELDNQNITPAQFAEELKALGFTDLTPYQSPYDAPPKKQKPTRIKV